MQPPPQTQGNTSGRVNLYVFRRMNDIMDYLLPLIHGTVTGGSYYETVARCNYVR